MIDLRPVLFVVGLLLCALAAAMLVPAAVDLLLDDRDWLVFVYSAAVTAFIGGGLALAMRSGDGAHIGLREAFLLTVLSWTLVSFFAAIPFYFSNLNLDLADAVFEAVSGLTTTGSTVIANLDTMPRGILLWRSVLHLVGGIGIVVMAIAMLPLLQVGGMQLFRTESSDRSEKVFPRVKQVTGAVMLVYAALAVSCTVALLACGLGPFDAVNHAISTISTGGFSTKDASIAHFKNPAVEWVVLVFMILGGITFTLHFRAIKQGPRVYWLDRQVRWFIALLAAASVSITVWIVVFKGLPVGDAARLALFNVTSIVTTTGFASADYTLWGTYPIAAFYFLTFVGGCTGSTAGGIKIFRFQVIHAVAHQQLIRLLAPHRISIAKVQGQEIDVQVAVSVLGFFFFYAMTFAVTALALGLFGLDAVTALSGAATAVGNVGPGLGAIIGPAGNFAPLPDGAKWILSAAMLLGRLEFVTVFVLLTRSFWRE